MRSSELARLAGVTVRALRHYHQVGVLAEPQRGTNGYRSYDVHDLIRVIRIRRLASVGIPLERMPALLDDTDDDAGLLDGLEAELTAEIDRLIGQRAVVAQLRAHGAPPDVPPELAPYLALLAGAGVSPELARIDRDQVILLAHLVGEDGMPGLAQFYAGISRPELAPAIARFAARFGALDEGSTDGDIDELVDDFATTLAPLLAELADPAEAIAPATATTLFAEYSDDRLNAPQHVALERIAAALS